MSIIGSLAARIAGLRPKSRRLLVAVAGPPASGKSTFAAELAAHLGAGTALVPMDGFHLDNPILDDMGLRHRKGAPETFDSEGFVHMILRLGSDERVVFPIFDRTHDVAIAGAQVIGPETQVVVIEGNYLLLDEAPWHNLHALWDLSVFLDVPQNVLNYRLIQRWIDHDHTREEAMARAQTNDLPNAQRVIERSIPADHVVQNAS